MKSSSFRRIDLQKKQSRRIMETGEHCRGSMKYKWEHYGEEGVCEEGKSSSSEDCFSCCKLARLGFRDDIVSQFGTVRSY